MLPVYEEIIRDGSWWDFADGVAGRICALLQAHRAEMSAVILRISPLSRREALKNLAK